MTDYSTIQLYYKNTKLSGILSNIIEFAKKYDNILLLQLDSLDELIKSIPSSRTHVETYEYCVHQITYEVLNIVIRYSELLKDKLNEVMYPDTI